MNQRRLFFVDNGGSGEPVVLLHAFPLDGRMWEAQARELSRQNRVIVPDLPGFGRSADTPASSLDHMADEVAALLDALNIERATIAGLSMGGYATLAFARRHPNRVARLGLCDTRSMPDSPEARKARDANIALVDREGVGALVERMLPVLLSSSASRETTERVRVIGGSQSAAGVQAALAAMRDRPDATPWLTAFDAPAMVIVGADDALSPPSEAQSIAGHLPRADLEVIAGAGHLCNLEKPTAFTAALARLLERT
jgi:pimeloyl-ACP methyl ester carboxylesterase